MSQASAVRGGGRTARCLQGITDAVTLAAGPDYFGLQDFMHI
jgi:hypothetical protein